MQSNRAKAALSNECISGMIFQATQFPGAEVDGFIRNVETGSWEVYYRHPDLPAIEEGLMTPLVELVNDAAEPARDADGNTVQ